MEHNAYQAPEASLIEESTIIERKELASRWRRLGAAFLDGLILLIPSSVIMYFLGSFQNIMDGVLPSWEQVVILFISTLFLHVLINLRPLKENGQTLGKKALRIKVVTMKNMKPDLATLIVKRYLSFAICGEIPVVGNALSTINILLIFGNNKRCGHDYIAGTKVVES